jgi:hypothetical protein
MKLGSLLDAAITFCRAEARNVRRFDVPWRRRLWLYRHGFLSSKAAIWNPSDRTVDRFLTDLESRRLPRIGGRYRMVLRNKLLFHLLVSRTHDQLLPSLHGIVRDGRLVETDQYDWLESFEAVERRLAEERLVAKPVTAEKGDGVRVLDGRTGGVTVDGETRPGASLPEMLASDRDLLLVEHVEQATYAATVFPDATNTLRVLTMIDPDTGEPFIASAVHRFGTATSAPIDNWVAGGASAAVDTETGELGRTVWHPRPGSDPTWHDVHPETGAQIAGTVVPGWDGVKATVLDLAEAHGWLWPHVGWDVVVEDEQATVTVLEGELHSAGTDQQAHAPLLADERVRRFYAHHGVLDSTEDGVSGAPRSTGRQP